MISALCHVVPLAPVLYAASLGRMEGVNLAYNTDRRLLGREASFDRDLPSDDGE